MIDLKINGTSIATWVIPESLRITQNLTNEPDTAQFSIRLVGSRTAPVFDDDVLIYDGTTKIFGGKVAEVTSELSGAKIPVATVRCVDNTFEFDRVLAAKTYESVSVSAIISDLVASYASGFGTAYVDSDFVIEKIVFNQIPLSQCLKKLADIVRYDWYIDEDKQIHFFEKFTNTAPYDLTDTNGNYIFESLQRASDGSQLVNRVKVRGGEYDGASFTDILNATGSATSFSLPYRFSNLQVELSNTSGTAFAVQGLGVDFIDTFGTATGTTIAILYNYQEKTIRFETAPDSGKKIRFSGNPKVPVIAIAEDSVSVAQYGAIEKLIRDTSIASNAVARRRAAAELTAFADSVIDASFTTYTAGLRAGMLINVASSNRNFDDDLLIKQIIFTARTNSTFEYNVQCISTQRYTLLDLLRKIITPDARPEDEAETSEQIYAVNEEITALDEWRQVSPELITGTVTASDEWISAAGTAIAWVYGYYAPPTHATTKRMGRYDRGATYG